MHTTALRSLGRSPLVAALRAAVVVAPAASASAAPAAHHRSAVAHAGCAAAHSDPAAVSDAQLRHSVLCLLNAERTRHGLHRLRMNARLSQASRRHARDMVQRHYFAHSSRNGESFSARILATGYGRRGFRLLGENLVWGTGSSASPAGVVDMWMHSPGHRANILRAGFREIGIGVVRGTPGSATAGATYATDFGAR
jgi:uncharacterized protein YkwD